MGNTDLLLEAFHEKCEAAEKEYISMKQLRSGTITQPNGLERISLSKSKRKYRLRKRYFERRDAKVYQN